MSIQDKRSQFKGLLRNTDFVLSCLIVVISLISFSLGRISTQDSVLPTMQESKVLSPIIHKSVQEEPIVTPITSQTEVVGTTTSENRYVASKSGSKYHLPWCGGAKQIKEENKIWFSSKDEAEKAGYTPASNCKGI